MADAAVNLRSVSASDDLVVTIKGKLKEQRRGEDMFYSLVLCPALDEYSSPRPFEIRSEKSLGRENEDVSVRCALGGYFRRAYNYDDPKTGEVRRIKPVVHSLDAIDAF